MRTFDWEYFDIDIPYGKRGGQVKVICPKCNQHRTNKRDKSLSCNLETGQFHCHYCGFSGLARIRSEEEVRQWMRQQPWYNERPMPKTKREYKKPKPRKTFPMSAKALAWFAGRGISQATLEAMRVTEGMEWMPQKDCEWNTVQFNYYREGELVNTKFRTGDKCFKMVAGAELLPYNIDRIKGEKECIITEGEMDALSFYECGFANVISVPNGANANLDYLDDYIEAYFEDKETIYIAVDTDTKGVILRDELLRRFGAERCRILEYGEDCKDANELLMQHGKESLVQCLRNAPEIKVEGVFTVADFESNLDSLFANGMQRGVTIGHENFDNLCSFETKRLCIVTGIPGSGKSEFIDEICERLNINYGWRTAYFSPENAPLAYHASKLIEKFTGKKFDKEHLSLAEYVQVKSHLEENFYFILPSDYKLSTILTKAKFLVRRKGIKVLVIDPYNRLEDESDGGSETRYISKLLDQMTNFAQQNDVLVILMAHPTKLQKDKDGKLNAPTLYDISGSAHFFNKCDYGIVVHRNKELGYVEVHVLKVKFRHLGQTGLAQFKYNLNNGRYTPYTIDVEPNWDNSNHLRQLETTRQIHAMQNATLDLSPTDDCPF